MDKNFMLAQRGRSICRKRYLAEISNCRMLVPKRLQDELFALLLWRSQAYISQADWAGVSLGLTSLGGATW